ncbi:MAG: ECF transporter S component [Armatimonadetes bacterium]|nr:ECF transporter S component [Armatimonadota bacterium]
MARAEATIAEQYAWARDLSLGGLFMALGVVVPIIFHALGGGHLGAVFLPMYAPVLACAMLVSPGVGLLVGLLTPALSSALTGMPPVLPVLPLIMAELGLMALVAGLLRRKLGLHVVPALIVTLVLGRVVTGLTVVVMIHLLPAALVASLPPIMHNPLTYVAAATVKALPGLALNLLIVPAVVLAVEGRSLIGARHAR